jgi:hypothetical protein
MKGVVDTAGDRLLPIYATTVDAHAGPVRPLTVYHLTHWTPGPPAKLTVSLRFMLGRSLER